MTPRPFVPVHVATDRWIVGIPRALADCRRRGLEDPRVAVRPHDLLRFASSVASLHGAAVPGHTANVTFATPKPPDHQEGGPMKGLEDKVALVTGGSSGIGQAIAIRLGQEGVHVAVNYVGPAEGAEATKDAIDAGVEHCMNQVRAAGARALLVEADVSNDHEVEAMFKTVTHELGPVD